MHELAHICELIEQSVLAAREKATARHWGEYSRQSFILNLNGIIPLLEQLLQLFRDAKTGLEMRPEAGKPELKGLIGELSQLIGVLKRNREMEEARTGKIKEQGIHVLAQTITVPELYADLEQKTLAALLKGSYMAERLRVFDRKRDSTLSTKAGQANIIMLLEQKEKELSDLREKYEENRKNSFLGLAEKESATDIENELNAASRQLESRTAITRRMFEEATESMARLERQLQGVGEHVRSVEDIEAQLTAKTFELVTVLKKERDYTKKVLMEIEHDTVQLRNTYSKELISMQEEKIGARNELEQKHEREISAARRDIHEKNQMLSHLRDTVAAREKKIQHLEGEMEKLQLINKSYHKHHAIKEHLLRHGKGREKRDG